MGLYYDVDGKALNFNEWAKLLVNEEYSRVAETVIHGQIADTDLDCDLWVTTKWIGLNMGHSDGPLRIFETAVFSNPEAKLWIRRYSSRAEAKAGHATVVWLIYMSKKPDDELPYTPKCVTCLERPVRERIRFGSWLCLECEIEINTGSLLHPRAKVMV